jgi:hypothetical protein
VEEFLAKSAQILNVLARAWTARARARASREEFRAKSAKPAKDLDKSVKFTGKLGDLCDLGE